MKDAEGLAPAAPNSVGGEIPNAVGDEARSSPTAAFGGGHAQIMKIKIKFLINKIEYHNIPLSKP